MSFSFSLFWRLCRADPRPGSLEIWEIERALAGAPSPLAASGLETASSPGGKAAGADPGQAVSGTQPQGRGPGFCFQGRRIGQMVIYKKRGRERCWPLQYLPQSPSIRPTLSFLPSIHPPETAPEPGEDAQMRPARPSEQPQLDVTCAACPSALQAWGHLKAPGQAVCLHRPGKGETAGAIVSAARDSFYLFPGR